jgi:hypothetical protein
MHVTGYEVVAATAMCSEILPGYHCDSLTLAGISVAACSWNNTYPPIRSGPGCVLPLAQAYTYCNSDPACGGVSVCGTEPCAEWNAIIKYGGALFGVPPNVAVCSANNPDWASYRKLPGKPRLSRASVPLLCCILFCRTHFCETNASSVVLPCPANGGWSAWSSCLGSSCDGVGTQTRTCTNPAPSGSGATCSGSNSQSCSMPACIWWRFEFPVSRSCLPC